MDNSKNLIEKEWRRSKLGVGGRCTKSSGHNEYQIKTCIAKIKEKSLIWTTIWGGGRRSELGHLLRNNTSIPLIIKGKIDEKPSRERPRQSYMKQIMLYLEKRSFKE